MVSLRLAVLLAACGVSVLAACAQSTVTVYVGYNNTLAFRDDTSGSTSSLDSATNTPILATTNIHEGDTVQFVWQGSPHNINPYPDGAFHNTGYMTAQTSSQIVGSSTWDASKRRSTYQCSLHPTRMNGEIYVYEAVTSFTISAPPRTLAGTPFDITVTAAGQNGTADGLYLGTIRFSSSDTNAGVQLPPNYTFVPADKGIHRFTGLVLKTVNASAMVTVTATTGGLTGNATIKVDNGPTPQAPSNLRVSPSGKGF